MADMQREFWAAYKQPQPEGGYTAGPAVSVQCETNKGGTVVRLSVKDDCNIAIEMRFSAPFAPSSPAWKAILEMLWQHAQGGGGQPRPKPAGSYAKALADDERRNPEAHERLRRWEALREAGKVQGFMPPPGWTPDTIEDANILPTGA